MKALFDNLRPASSQPAPLGQRTDGYLPLEQYAALGDGRSVALSGIDGAIDWWCVPNMDSPPLFDRLLNSENGGVFSIKPDEPYRGGLENLHTEIIGFSASEQPGRLRDRSRE